MELRNELSANQDTPELCFVEEAIQLLNERRAKLLQVIIILYSLRIFVKRVIEMTIFTNRMLAVNPKIWVAVVAV